MWNKLYIYSKTPKHFNRNFLKFIENIQMFFEMRSKLLTMEMNLLKGDR